ncbi:hypothetical protein GUJ93_ZPchr0008g14148 [Zizania palustris]|uniref:RNase H type-1 domain-containing protein n=2 Tax=Zizania palustris TaxID=103762 RepID=A0A8J5RIV6_ZIZPA|nr:hypothetical protein GUJ93_ZPchr0008g14148 [Zizania palustris]KAG8046634.1 hypothetical protein GUJ93_ZPchr0008g14148 [Zizania palustris]
MRSCTSSLCGISRVAWRRYAVAGALNQQQQHHHHLRYLALRPPAPPPIVFAIGRFFSSSTRRPGKRSAAAKQQGSQPPPPPPPMDAAGGGTGEPFYVVRKGDVIGIYKSLSDCQLQVSNSVCDPSVTVYKGYSLRKETEEYLAARGLRHPLYSINAADARDELFDDLVPCPFQQPDGTGTSTLKRSVETETGPSKKQPKVIEQEPLPDSSLSCILEFDGASKGNPGKAGAGAVVRRLDGTVIAQLREGLGIATNNAAEYRALILGLRYAAKKGFKYIRAQGDSKLVCYQVCGCTFATSILHVLPQKQREITESEYCSLFLQYAVH